MPDYSTPEGKALFESGVRHRMACGMDRDRAEMLTAVMQSPIQLAHNVDDRRRSWVGSWEVEPLDYSRLGPEHVGRTVIYRDHGRAEAGTITSWRNGVVFARYSRGDTSAGANASMLVLGVRPLDGPELKRADGKPTAQV